MVLRELFSPLVEYNSFVRGVSWDMVSLFVILNSFIFEDFFLTRADCITKAIFLDVVFNSLKVAWNKLFKVLSGPVLNKNSHPFY